MTHEYKIKVCYRASFQQPIGPLNPLKVKVPDPIPVELRRFGFGMGQWIACRPGDRTPGGIFQEITAQPSAEALQSQMSLYFRTRLTEWEVWTAELPQRKLQKHEYLIRDGQAYAPVIREAR